MYDLLIKNGSILDGTGSPAYGADVAAVDVANRGRRGASGVPAFRVLDLDDVRAEMGEELGGEGHRLHLFDGEDADALERETRRRVHELLPASA